MVTLLVLAEQHEMIGFIRLVARRGTGLAVGRRVHLAADDGLDLERVLGVLVVRRRFLVKGHRAVHVAVVGDRDRGLTQLRAAREQLAYLGRAVEQRIFGMKVQMYESLFFAHLMFSVCFSDVRLF